MKLQKLKKEHKLQNMITQSYCLRKDIRLSLKEGGMNIQPMHLQEEMIANGVLKMGQDIWELVALKFMAWSCKQPFTVLTSSGSEQSGRVKRSLEGSLSGDLDGCWAGLGNRCVEFKNYGFMAKVIQEGLSTLRQIFFLRNLRSLKHVFFFFL